MASQDEVTLSIDGPDGTEEVTLPSRLLEMLAEGDESAAEVVADLAMFGCAQRIHATVHHSEGGVEPELEEVEATTMELFEERFGASYGELTGHQH
jgi:hypothetical protein